MVPNVIDGYGTAEEYEIVKRVYPRYFALGALTPLILAGCIRCGANYRSTIGTYTPTGANADAKMVKVVEYPEPVVKPKTTGARLERIEAMLEVLFNDRQALIAWDACHEQCRKDWPDLPGQYECPKTGCSDEIKQRDKKQDECRNKCNESAPPSTC